MLTQQRNDRAAIARGSSTGGDDASRYSARDGWSRDGYEQVAIRICRTDAASEVADALILVTVSQITVRSVTQSCDLAILRPQWHGGPSLDDAITEAVDQICESVPGPHDASWLRSLVTEAHARVTGQVHELHLDPGFDARRP